MTKVNFYISYLKIYFIFKLYFVVLAIYGFKYLGYDSKMSVLCFLHISNDSIVDECFNCCEGVLSTKLALYIYALRYAHKVMRNVNIFKVPTDQVCNFFFKIKNNCISNVKIIYCIMKTPHLHVLSPSNA